MVTIELIHEDSYDMYGGLIDNNFVARVYTTELNGPAIFTADCFQSLRDLAHPRKVMDNIWSQGLLPEADLELLIDDIRKHGYTIGSKHYRAWGTEEEGGE